MTVSRLPLFALPALLMACAPAPPTDRIRVSGNVEATEVHTAAEVAGRIVDLRVDEGDRIEAGGVIARLDTEDTMLQIARMRADRATAVAQLRLLEAGSRAEDIRQARAQVDVLEKSLRDANVISPISGIVTQKLVDAGEIVARGTPLVVITDLDHAWANLFVPEPMIPRVAIGQAAMVLTDAGGQGLEGKVTFVSPRAEFTPRNVQTAEERSKLVYRIKVTVDNSAGILKLGMQIGRASCRERV